MDCWLAATILTYYNSLPNACLSNYQDALNDKPPANVLAVIVLFFSPSSNLPVASINLTAVTYTLYSVYGLTYYMQVFYNSSDQPLERATSLVTTLLKTSEITYLELLLTNTHTKDVGPGVLQTFSTCAVHVKQ